MNKIIKIDKNTKYRSLTSFDDNSLIHDVLILFYLPLIKSSSITLYLLLILDSKNTSINTIFISIDRIISLTNMSFEKIESSLNKLVMVNLINIFKDDKNNIIFVLKKPLTPKNFNNSKQFLSLFNSSSGNENLYINNKFFSSLKETKKFENFKKVINEIDISPKKDIEKNDLNVKFDFSNIKKILSTKKINWSDYWSNELENELLNLIIIFEIDSFSIAIEMIKEIESGKFSINQLVRKIENKYKKIENPNLIISEMENYSIDVKLDFLNKISINEYFINKFNREPFIEEKELIKKLGSEFNLSNKIINILLDYSTIVNNDLIIPNYILKIAKTIRTKNINDPKKVIQFLKNSYKIRENTNNENYGNKFKLMDDIPIF